MAGPFALPDRHSRLATRAREVSIKEWQGSEQKTTPPQNLLKSPQNHLRIGIDHSKNQPKFHYNPYNTMEIRIKSPNSTCSMKFYTTTTKFTIKSSIIKVISLSFAFRQRLRLLGRSNRTTWSSLCGNAGEPTQSKMSYGFQVGFRVVCRVSRALKEGILEP